MILSELRKLMMVLAIIVCVFFYSAYVRVRATKTSKNAPVVMRVRRALLCKDFFQPHVYNTMTCGGFHPTRPLS